MMVGRLLTFLLGWQNFRGELLNFQGVYLTLWLTANSDDLPGVRNEGTVRHDKTQGATRPTAAIAQATPRKKAYVNEERKWVDILKWNGAHHTCTLQDGLVMSSFWDCDSLPYIILPTALGEFYTSSTKTTEKQKSQIPSVFTPWDS